MNTQVLNEFVEQERAAIHGLAPITFSAALPTEWGTVCEAFGYTVDIPEAGGRLLVLHRPVQFDLITERPSQDMRGWNISDAGTGMKFPGRGETVAQAIEMARKQLRHLGPMGWTDTITKAEERKAAREAR